MGKVSSRRRRRRRRKSKLLLGRPPYLFSKFTNPPDPAPGPTPPPANPFDTAETKRLRRELHELQLEEDKLIPRENLLKRKVRVLQWKMAATQTAFFDWKRRSSLPYGVIPFVAAIDEADRYFDFKKAAIRKYRNKSITQRNLLPLDIQRILLDDDELNSKFNRFDDLELAEAAIAIFDKLHAEQEKKHQVDLQNCLFQGREDPALTRPIYNLVFQTRRHATVMDQDPVVELEKIMKYNPSLYDGCFLLEARPKKYSAYFNVREEQVDFSAYFNAMEKKVDFSATAMTEARIKYSEIWSTYFKASGAKTKKRKMVDHGKNGESRSKRPRRVSPIA